MKSNNRNDQLDRFFQHNPIEDPLYLKKYVKEHPDHKMAWYLLGREYTAQGKAGKAAYCFAQAGEIYEAFEQQKIVLDGPIPTTSTAVMASKIEVPVERRSASRNGRIGVFFLILFLLLAIPAGMDLAKSEGIEEIVVAEQPEGATAVTAFTSIQSDNPGIKLYVTDGNWGKKLQQILEPPTKATGESVIMDVPPSQDGQWREWYRAVRPLLSVEHSGTGANEAVLKYYQAQICACQVADSSKLVPIISAWMHDREEAIILKSAIQAYQIKTGALPDNPQQLTKPYPDNLLPGLTPQMKAAFPAALQKVAELAGGKVAQVPNPTGGDTGGQPTQSNEEKAVAAGNAQALASSEPFQEPLRIIIDTDQHQLAVASGDIILRRYEVGLGGSKTPQGDFVISEKVRNPNGRSNGEFGSRGMTLSNTLYAIHGTNKPKSIGKDESHGCIRMLQQDVEELYNMVSGQTKVTIGKGVLPSGEPGDGIGAGGGKPQQAISLPLETKDHNPGKVYRWLN
ncbi:L,D-transpeptidase [Paenibacillus qinlingensis]|uniref:Lipoprotein-anchoring transpeptidase ErfK/SrfK n=1 Tax=Paenibacillus qinlingensis TaxID=1837343 RepID=A0ABU1NN94_9BACL|nr:L,D-transpeptidase [Paenibacillus qinlingensis]MDR6548935.1 lipoprotein-anchoring transpeptidase ErfK/SrfK [Paenibacillus qinlingensis]